MPTDVEWNNATQQITRQIVRIETENSFGTGFITHAAYDLRGIATAFHVIKEAYENKRPIRIRYKPRSVMDVGPGTGNECLIVRSDPPNTDIVLLIVLKADSIQKPVVSLLPPSDRIIECAEVSWFGFPQFAPHTPCYFSGRISRIDLDNKRYLIDGAIVQGVSGSPVFCILNGKPVIIGSISSFLYIKQNMTPLPGGLSIATDASALIARLNIVEGEPGTGVRVEISEKPRATS